MTTPVSMVVIDDNRLMREGIAAMIHARPGFVVLAPDVEAALDKVREIKPDVVLLDFGLADHDSLNLTATIRAEVPEARVIVMGVVPDHEDVTSYARVGASGFVMKDASFDELLATIQTVASGKVVAPQAQPNSLLAHVAMRATAADKRRAVEAVRLTDRERQVIDLLNEGLNNRDIASRLHIAIHTVKSHVHNVLEKLSLRSRLEIAAYSHSAENIKTSGND